MIMPSDALDIILESVDTLGKEKISIFEAENRVAAEKLYSKLNLPAKDNAAMDGYAVRFEDIKDIPAQLKVVGTIKAGDSVKGLKLNKGECFRIMTGAFLPEGADIVVEFEATEESDNTVKILKQKKQYANVRFKGEDIKKGDEIDFVGEPLNAYRLARIVSTGNVFVDVYKKPSVCVISTGNELAYLDNFNEDSTIDSNSHFLRSILKELGINISYLGIVKDDENQLKETLNNAKEYDIIITTAGISFGDYDVVTNVEKEVGIEWKFKYVKQKPGKPFAFGRLNRSFIFSFPGNPVSTAFCSFFYLIPALKKMLGYKKYRHIPIKAILTEPIKKNNDRVHFNRVKVEFKDGKFFATPFKTQGSNIIESIATCNGFGMIESDIVGIVEEGKEILVYLYDFESVFG